MIGVNQYTKTATTDEMDTHCFQLRKPMCPARIVSVPSTDIPSTQLDLRRSSIGFRARYTTRTALVRGTAAAQ